ncbi:MAG: iron-containing alcohol dehydrogenase [Ottowia sp.]|nr:iron-containing alcohol dehydrogenase [Ottowia sp.]
MDSFVFQNRTRIYFGKGAVAQHLPAQIKRYGKRILLAYGGGSIKKNGIYDEVVGILKAAGCEVFDFAGIMPNPTKAKVEEGAALVRQHKIDLILAVGGGSTMDCAKAVAVAAVYKGDWWSDLWLKPGVIDFTPTPVATIVTMCGTGSEFDGGGVITNEDTKVKTGMPYAELSPDFSLLDPTYTLTVPLRQVRAGAFDTMSHLMEHYIARPDDDNISDELCEGLLRAQIRNFRAAMKDPQDWQARSNIMWISSIALCGLVSVGKRGDYDCHNLEHQVGAFTDCVHGEGLAVVHPPPPATARAAAFCALCHQGLGHLARRQNRGATGGSGRAGARRLHQGSGSPHHHARTWRERQGATGGNCRQRAHRPRHLPQGGQRRSRRHF